MEPNLTDMMKASYDAGRNTAASGQPIPKELLVDNDALMAQEKGLRSHLSWSDFENLRPNYESYFTETEGHRATAVPRHQTQSHDRSQYLSGYADEMKERLQRAGVVLDADMQAALLSFAHSPDLTQFQRGFDLEEKIGYDIGRSAASPRAFSYLATTDRFKESGSQAHGHLRKLGVLTRIVVEYEKPLSSFELAAIANHTTEFRWGLSEEAIQTKAPDYSEIPAQLRLRQQLPVERKSGLKEEDTTTRIPLNLYEFIDHYSPHKEDILPKRSIEVSPSRQGQADLAFRIGQELRAKGPVTPPASSSDSL